MKHRAYKYRFYPTFKQKELLLQTFGCIRVVYNKSLHVRQEAYINDNIKIGYHETSSLLTEWKQLEEYKWLNDVSSIPLQQSLRHVQKAFTNFFAGRAKYPNFKKKSSFQSAEFTKSAFRWDGKNLFLAKTKDPLNIRWSRYFSGDPSTVTISKDSANRYFVSILVKEEIPYLDKSENSIGIDVGLKSLVTLSTGETIKGINSFRTNETKLAKLQRKLSSKRIGSNNRDKARLKVARLHAKIADTRRDFNHKLSTRLIRENQTIAVETLSVKNMMKNSKLSKAIADASWGQLLGFLKYKAEWYGRELIEIDRWFPSSKRCSSCGYTLDNLPLSVRSWTCPECRTLHDRDVNAACNILAVGQAVSAFGENVSLVSCDISNSP